MCGLAALFEAGRSFEAPLLGAIERDLHHRGPDSGGRVSEPGIGLVFRRLAIIDPEARSDQPMSDPTGRCTLIFNGEIYNYRALQRALRQEGVTLRSDGDSEVILQGYKAWGEGVFQRLEGMYALVLVDRERGEAIAARDPYGIKPLYVARKAKGGGILTAFASELRPLRRLVGTEIDSEAMAELLLYRFAGGRMSNLKGIELLPGGTLARLSLADGSYSERRFCDVLDTLRPDDSLGAAEAEELIEEAVTRALEDHLVSDVGYAVQLSGGVDSSLVVALASTRTPVELKTYGVHLGDLPQDEGPYRDLVVERYKPHHQEVTLTARDYAEALPRAAAHMEGPIAHFACPMLMLLCDRIRATDKVVLTGEGADEFFGGYFRYGDWKRVQRHGRLARLVPSFAWPLLARYRGIKRYVGRAPEIAASVYYDLVELTEAFPDLVPKPGPREAAAARFDDFRDRMLASDQTAYLGSLLMRQDKMAMAASVEARVPFTYLPLARALNRLPRDLRIPGGETKPLLKQLARKLLPAELVDRRKVGLLLPLADWLKEPDTLGRYLDYMTDSGSGLARYTEPKRLRKLVEDFRAAERHPGVPVLAHLAMIEAWLRTLDARGEFASAALEPLAA